MNWRQSIIRSSGSARVADISKYVTRVPPSKISPIDIFFNSTMDILRAASPSLFTNHPALGPLMLVGFVSATENYFRDVFARIISICPIAQESAAQQMISLGTVLWHGGQLPERGAFEHISFTSSENVKTTAKRFLDYEVRRNTPIDAALSEFEKICELRHGVVHSGSVLAGKNALKLQLAKTTSASSRIAVGFSELQECADICTTLAVVVNHELFSLIVERWATHWRRRASWNPAQANAKFSSIWSMFLSQLDYSNSLIPVPMGMRKCRSLVCTEFRL